MLSIARNLKTFIQGSKNTRIDRGYRKALMQGNADKCRKFLLAGAEVKFDQNSVHENDLIIAYLEGKVEILKLLVEQTKNEPHTREIAATLLEYAFVDNHHDAIKLLLPFAKTDANSKRFYSCCIADQLDDFYIDILDEMKACGAINISDVVLYAIENIDGKAFNSLLNKCYKWQSDVADPSILFSFIKYDIEHDTQRLNSFLSIFKKSYSIEAINKALMVAINKSHACSIRALLACGGKTPNEKSEQIETIFKKEYLEKAASKASELIDLSEKAVAKPLKRTYDMDDWSL